MPGLSNKALQLPASPIRKLVPYAESAKEKGINVFHLNIGQPDIPTPKVVLKAIRSYNDPVIEYSHSAGFLSYRKGLANYYNNLGINITSSDIIITTGGSEALLFGFMACLNEGDEVVIPEPFYANYNGFAAIAGVKIIPVPANIEDGFALPPLSEFEKVISPRTKAILVCNPGNPTGTLYTEEEMLALRDIVKKHDLFLFADEVYREFCYDGSTHFSALSLEDIDQNVILVDSVSKRYSMCGSRIGAIVSRNKEVMSAVLKFAQARLSPPTLGQVAGEAALETPQTYFLEVISEYVHRRDVLVDGLNSIPGVFCPKPQGAFYCIARLPIDDADKFAQWLLEDFSHEGNTVMVAPASGFYSTPGSGHNEVRLAYVLEIPALQKAVECLKVALEKYPGRIKSTKKKILAEK